MKHFVRIAKISIVSLALSLFVGAPAAMQSASATGTVTKTINVKDSNGAALPDALVAVGYEDANAPGGWVWTSPVTTNSSGQAVLSNLPLLTTEWTELYVEPPVGDTVDAFGFQSKDNGNFNLSSSSTVNVNLQAATVRVNLVKSTGGAAPVHSYIAWPKDSSRSSWNVPNILREGPFGIYVDSSLNCTNNGGNWNMSFGYPDSSTGEASNSQFILVATGCNPTRSITFKEAISGNTSQQVDGVWQLASYKRSFFFNIVGPSDLVSIESAWLDVCKVTDNGDQCFGGNGNVGVPDGTYKLRANPGDSGYATSLFTATISNSGQTISMKVGYPAGNTDVPLVNGRYKFALGVPNLSGWITKPNGETLTLTNNQGFDVQLLKRDSNNNYQYVTSTWSNGRYGFNIDSTGLYKVSIHPYGFSDFAASTSPIITATNSGGIKLAWDTATAVTTLVHDIALAVPNVVLNVLDPNTLNPLSNGWVTLEKIIGDNGQRQWAGNLDIDNQNPGRAAGLVEDGTYLLTANPPQGNQAIAGLAAKRYTMVISGSGTVIELHKGNTAQGEVVNPGNDGSFTISVGAANVIGRFLDRAGQPVSSNQNSWASACLQRLMQNGVNWEWITCSNTSLTGAFSISATDLGTYRVSIEPQGRSDIATTILETFTLTNDNINSFIKNYGDVTGAAPTLKIRVREEGQTSNVRYSGIEIRKNDQFVGWANTMQAGEVAVNLASAGTYQLIVNPTEETPDSTRKSYTVTAVVGDGGVINATINGVTVDPNGISTLNLGTAQIKGHVYLPGSTTPVQDAFVVAVDKESRQEMWQYGANTNVNGGFGISLPEGTYTIYARTPNGLVSAGNSDPIGDVAVDANGNVTLSNSAAALSLSDFVITLASPFWHGKVLPPTGSTGISNARVCLNTVINGAFFNNCANTNSQGVWAMGKPQGFTDFGDESQLQVAENQNAQFAMLTLNGKTAIEGSGFIHGGVNSQTDINLRLPAPNFTVHVVYGQTPDAASNMWVNLNRINGGWLGGSQTDQNGDAKFYVSDLTHGVQVQIDPTNNPDVAAVAATTMKQFLDGEMASHVSNSQFNATITMLPPNLRGIVTDPYSGAAVPNTWVELFDASTNMWKGGANTNRDGYFGISAVEGRYTIRVNPSGSSSAATTNHSFDVVVDATPTVSSVTDKVTLQAANTRTYGTNSAYVLPLGKPSVTGKVTNPSNANVPNSWVVPTDESNNNQLWQIGASSRNDGSFNMAVPDGSYKIQANVPWGSSSLSSSAYCSVTIQNGGVSTASGGCVQDNHSILLQLRAPNLRVRVLDSANQPLANAHVGLGLGSWNANAQTDSNGWAALFVDPSAMYTSNGGRIAASLQDIWMWIDPPYGNSDVVRSQCHSLQADTPCATLPQVLIGNGTFADESITAALPAPNTSVYVKLPDNSSAGANAWVSIMQIFKNGSGQETGRSWLGGSNTDSNGKATFNLVDTSVAFSIQVEAPWNQRDQYAGAIFESATGVLGLPWSSVNGQSFKLSSPNLTIAARTVNGLSPLSNSWISIEKAADTTDNHSIGWVGGYGLDQNGKASLKLAANGRFRITLNPGPGVIGVATVCIVTTDAGGVVSLVSNKCGAGTISSTVVTLPIATGNVTGIITGPDAKPVVGAIVSAKPVNAVDDSRLQVTSTDKNGVYNLDLDSAVHWDVTITPVNTPADTTRLASKVLADQIVSGSNNTISTSVVVAS